MGDKRFAIIILALIALSGIVITQVAAQSDASPWTPPFNVSQSGAASLPVIVASPDGTLYVMWWDATEGELFARAPLTSTDWTQPASVPPVYGLRRIDDVTKRVLLAAPQMVRLAAATSGEIHALWIDNDSHLLDTQTTADSWSNGVSLAEAASTFAVASDVSGTLHLAYARPLNASGAPSGVYYRVGRSGNWSNASLVYESAYFRTTKPGAVHLGAAGDNQDHAIVVWDDPQSGQSMYARSSDGGSTWSTPQVISATQGSRATQARIAAAPDGEFLLQWQEAGTGGCGSLIQRGSLDGGQTWSAPERILSSLEQCPADWTFMPGGDGRLWLIGASSDTPGAERQTVILAAWDGQTWSKPSEVNLSFYDPTSRQTINLGCLDIALNGQGVGLVGCASNDVWAARNAIGLDRLSAALKTEWTPLETISNGDGQAAPDGLPAIVADTQGHFYATWSQATSDGGTLLYATAWSGSHWSRPVRIMYTLDASADAASPSELAQPSLASDNNDKLHITWSDKARGAIRYSWVYANDAASPQAWAAPIDLPTPTTSTASPDVAVAPDGDAVYVVYTAPINEQRGIYLVRSKDGGVTWSQPETVFDAVAAKWSAADKPRLAYDSGTNTLHVVWLRTNVLSDVPSRAIYYSRSTDDGHTWSEPLKIGEGNLDWPQIVVAGNGQVYLAWNQSTIQNRVAPSTLWSVWGQFSPDNGERWTAASNVPGFEQVSGPIGLAADNAGHLYLAAIGTSANDESALLYAEWNGQSWNERETLGLGQNAVANNAAAVAIAPQAGYAVVALREWMWHDNSVGQFEIVGTRRNITSKALTPAPTFTPQPAATSVSTPTPHQTPTPAPPPVANVKEPALGGTAPSPLILGSVLATGIVVVAVSFIFWKRRN
jgi:hypothetical protein